METQEIQSKMMRALKCGYYFCLLFGIFTLFAIGIASPIRHVAALMACISFIYGAILYRRVKRGKTVVDPRFTISGFSDAPAFHLYLQKYLKNLGRARRPLLIGVSVSIFIICMSIFGPAHEVELPLFILLYGSVLFPAFSVFLLASAIECKKAAKPDLISSFLSSEPTLKKKPEVKAGELMLREEEVVAWIETLLEKYDFLRYTFWHLLT